jgi:CHAD domain-containing protein
MAEQDGSILAQSLDECWKRYRKTFRAAKSILTEKWVHDLRVALRRLDAVLDLTGMFLPHSHTVKVRRSLKRLVKHLSSLRDIQVQQRLVADLTKTYPELLKFQKHLVKQERVQIRALKKTVRRKHEKLANEFTKTFFQSRNLLRTFTPAETEQMIIGAVNKAYGTAIDAKRATESQDTSAIHAMRIAFRKFRYTVESAQPFLHDIPETVLARMQNFQNLMGNIQDVDVLFDTLARWGSKRGKRTRQKLAPIYQVVAQRRRSCIDEFVGEVDEIDSFWKFQSVEKRGPPVPFRSIR